MIPRLAIALYALVLVASSCSQAADTVPADVQLTVTLKDYTVTLSSPTVKAGTVKIGVQNSGAMAHQFDLIKTDLAADKLPIDGGSGTAKTDGLVKQVLNIGVGKVAVVTADLAAGHYVIICNVAGHYQLGMHADLTVQP
ncbi:MAG TPA: cupredoxin domain-containing protein [Candidatus Acidoferrales bacterium]|nr:cupredoxin domain-containing protein [Candidatus Acidoferrales bacterium]